MMTSLVSLSSSLSSKLSSSGENIGDDSRGMCDDDMRPGSSVEIALKVPYGRSIPSTGVTGPLLVVDVFEFGTVKPAEIPLEATVDSISVDQDRMMPLKLPFRGQSERCSLSRLCWSVLETPAAELARTDCPHNREEEFWS